MFQQLLSQRFQRGVVRSEQRLRPLVLFGDQALNLLVDGLASLRAERAVVFD